MTIEALIQLAAGNAGVNVANVGIASFAILTAVGSRRKCWCKGGALAPV